jgi:hypothetical protein
MSATGGAVTSPSAGAGTTPAATSATATASHARADATGRRALVRASSGTLVRAISRAWGRVARRASRAGVRAAIGAGGCTLVCTSLGAGLSTGPGATGRTATRIVTSARVGAPPLASKRGRTWRATAVAAAETRGGLIAATSRPRERVDGRIACSLAAWKNRNQQLLDLEHVNLSAKAPCKGMVLLNFEASASVTSFSRSLLEISSNRLNVVIAICSLQIPQLSVGRCEAAHTKYKHWPLIISNIGKAREFTEVIDFSIHGILERTTEANTGGAPKGDRDVE